ncbi:MAG: hypothetical protein H6738_11355 [Alphaproteobacteria bacterium]|nr:hypothetical protein [Alphaproteobacteria bacterium]MCB9697367.1 hypothetical protein [Alphaproteobacteria bacterium]
MIEVVIGRAWDGALLPARDRATIRLSWASHALRIEVDAPYHGDPPPPSSPGPTDGLWEHEVVELFVLLEQQGPRYVEIELGPHGHHLVLTLDGVRRPTARCLPLEYVATVDGDRWHGTALLDLEHLGDQRPVAFNATRIWGSGTERRYASVVALPGDAPDFHQPDRFVPWLL